MFATPDTSGYLQFGCNVPNGTEPFPNDKLWGFRQWTKTVTQASNDRLAGRLPWLTAAPSV